MKITIQNKAPEPKFIATEQSNLTSSKQSIPSKNTKLKFVGSKTKLNESPHGRSQKLSPSSSQTNKMTLQALKDSQYQHAKQNSLKKANAAVP